MKQKPLSILVILLTALPLVFLSAQTGAGGLTADQIITRMENVSSPDTAVLKGRMITTDRFGSKEIAFTSWAEGDNKSLLEFTSVEEEGQKILRIGDDLYVYYPDAQRTIRMQGSALRESIMGSDFSYEDMTTGDRGILADYQAELLGSETIDGFDCYRIKLTAKSRDLPYYLKEIWVDKEIFVYRKMQMFALSGRLLKEVLVRNIRKMGVYQVPVETLMTDKMKKNSSTAFFIDGMETDVNPGRNFFSLRELSR